MIMMKPGNSASSEFVGLRPRSYPRDSPKAFISLFTLYHQTRW